MVCFSQSAAALWSGFTLIEIADQVKHVAQVDHAVSVYVSLVKRIGWISVFVEVVDQSKYISQIHHTVSIYIT